MSIILPTALELAEGLGYLHQQGILHGDLSPGNVLLANEPGAPHGFTVKVRAHPTQAIAVMQKGLQKAHKMHHKCQR